MKKLLFTSVFLFFSGFVLAQSISLEPFKSGFSNPLDLQHAQDNRLFVVEQGGKIKIIQPNGTVNSTPFLDLSNQVSTGNEQGLLGLAFHPDYTNNGYFYVNYTDHSGATQISRFSVNLTNPDVADKNSELNILDFSQPFSNHNGGNIAFGPDGYLYISSGDGGGGGDPNNQAQNLNSFLGKLLRIDVDNPSGGNNYGIPNGNPYSGNPNAKEEIFAYGLRNPWRFSIDLVESNIWIADVGQGSVEEINRAPLTTVGINYGWRCYEGSQPFNTQNCPLQSELQFPFAEYTHANGNCSITGGFVYRGSLYLDIEGLYFFADFCTGMIGTVDGSGNILDYGNFSGNWVSIGEDVDKELYIIDHTVGSIYRIKGGQIANTDSPQLDNLLSIFPTPSSAEITFNLKNDKLKIIQLFDTRGRSVFSVKNISNNEKTISIEKLNSGIYFARITSDNGLTIVKKIIVQ